MNKAKFLIATAVLVSGSATAPAQDSASAQVSRPAESSLAQSNNRTERPVSKKVDCEPLFAQAYRPTECDPPLAHGAKANE
jgi:hypothetical protein